MRSTYSVRYPTVQILDLKILISWIRGTRLGERGREQEREGEKEGGMDGGGRGKRVCVN